MTNEAAAWRGIDLALAFVAAAMIVYGVLVLGWSVFVVIALFWLENVVIGIFNVARMLISGARLGGAGLIAALALSAFFTVHYGMFTAVHGVFVVMLFGQPELGGALSGLFGPLTRMIDYLLADRDGWFAAAGITLLQAAAFFRWMVASRAPSAAALPALMFAPYGRIVILHVTVIASGFLVAMLNMPIVGAILLVALKLVFDIVSVNSSSSAAAAKHVPVRRFIISREEDATRS